MINKYKKYRAYAKNLVTYFGASIIPMALGLIVNPWIAMNMTPRDYAISGYYTSFSSLISPIIIFYLLHFYIKEYYRINVQQRKILFAIIAKATIWFSGAISIICFIGLYIYLIYFNQELSFPIFPYLALMVFALPLTGLLNLQLAEYRMDKKANAFFRLSTCNGVLGNIINIILIIWLKWGAFGKLLGPLICNGIIFLYLFFKLRNQLKIPTPFKEFKRIFIFCLPLALSAALGYFTNGFTTTYLESIGNTTEYGYYVVGASMAAYLTTFTSAVGNTFQPDLYESTINKQWSRYAKFCILQISAYAIIAFSFILCAPFIISILTAGRYVESTQYAQIIALSTITSGIYFLINNFSIATNKPNFYLYTSIIGSALIVYFTPKFVNNWSFYGGAWMTVASFLIFSFINLILIGFSNPNLLKSTNKI